MPLIKFNGREVEFSVSGRGCDAMVEDAYFTDGAKEELSDTQIETIYQDYADVIEEEAYQNAVGDAEYACEGDR
jgi:hypothetical protein